MTEALEAQEASLSGTDEVLPCKNIIGSPPITAREGGEKDPAIQAGLVANAWSDSVQGIIEAGVLMLESRQAFAGDAALLDEFFTQLVEMRVFTASEARRRLVSPKFSKFCAIGENQALLHREQVIGFLGPSYTTIYQLIVLWRQLPQTDEQEKLDRLVAILESAPDEITREFLSDETERLKKPRKAPDVKRSKSIELEGGAAELAGEPGEHEHRVDVVLFTPSDRDLTALATPYARGDELERRLPALQKLRERDSIGLVVVARVSALPVIAEKLLPLCGFDFRQARTFLARRPESPEVTDADVIVVLQRGEVFLRPPNDPRWFDHDVLDPVVVASRLFPDAAKRLHMFARSQAPGWKSVIGAENWSEE